MLGDRVEPQSFFLGGRIGDDVPLSESDSSESGLKRFSPPSFGDRSSTEISEGDAEALGLWRNSG